MTLDDFTSWMKNVAKKKNGEKYSVKVPESYRAGLNHVIKHYNISLQQLAENIDYYLERVVQGGVDSRVGAYSNQTGSNAVKKFKEFIQTPYCRR